MGALEDSAQTGARGTDVLLLQQIPLRRGGRRCFLCVFHISQAAAPLADKSKVENTEAKLVTAGFVGAALIIVINFIY